MPLFQYALVLASADEADPIRFMQARSMRGLGRGFYEDATIESFLRAPGTLDAAVLGEGHYFLAKDAHGRILGSGAWSQLKPNYASSDRDTPLAGPGRCTIRNVFVDPDCARMGLGRAIMRHAEEDCARRGITTVALMATLSGVPLYEKLGYRLLRRHTLVLSDGQPFGVVDMEKRLPLLARAA